jgi:hypothetical protein
MRGLARPLAMKWAAYFTGEWSLLDYQQKSSGKTPIAECVIGLLGCPIPAAHHRRVWVATSQWTTAALVSGSTPLTRNLGASIDRQ